LSGKNVRGQRPGDAGAPGGLRVWIDQDLCTGDGLCVDYAPEVFTILEDGIAYVVDSGRVCNDPGGAVELARVPARFEKAVVDAAIVCPGACIMVEEDAED
jgi:ferredoxin